MRKRRIKEIIVMIVLLVLLSVACGSNQDEDSAKKDNAEQNVEDASVEQSVSKEKPFGNFQSETLEGEEITQEVFSNSNLTMVNIWGTFCGPCIQEMPELGELSREYADQGLQIIGMLCDVEEAGDETALEIVEKTQADYPHIVASMGLKLGILNEVYAVPTTIFVDQEGNQIGEVYSGARDKEGWTEVIEELLKQVKKE
ncbi:TlpA family protein disulfide reductase [Bariatricus sp. SGI.154]|uniref:TlpA family protein disulfide reductase n=1 Tax=Bariatricus sp. SGI.154 TaxID=3420549 RepID=UPI003D063342